MKITIDEQAVKDNGFTLNEVFGLLLIKTCRNIPKLIEDMLKKEYIVKEERIFGTDYLLTQNWNDKLSNCLLNSEVIDVKSYEGRLENLAKKLMEIYPKGKKEGTSQYWKGNPKDNRLRLKKFLKLYGEYTDEQIINATKKYVESFNGDYRYMRLLKYFIWKDEKKTNSDGVGYIEEVSELASFIENMDDDTQVNKDWTSHLV